MDTRDDPEAGKPGRPRSFDRSAALDRAIELFWQRGYEGVSIAALTDAMGIAPPSLYAAFGSKADLFREAIAHYSEHDGGGDPIPADADAYDTISASLNRGVRVVTQPGRPRGCMISSGMLASGPEHVGLVDELRQFRTSYRGVLQSKIQKDINAGILPASTDANALARFYASVSQGISIQALDGATTKELYAVVESALRAWPGERHAQASRK